ncbi:MAG: glutaredoxin family protein [Dethiobacter sp.]|jgi:glutaredoxin|nr:glutaredoxin family protein [Dethiobacter sp.]
MSCLEVKEFLSQHNFEFKEYNIIEDRNAFEEMWLISGQKAAPVTTVNDSVIVGFKKDMLSEALELNIF